MQVSCFVVRIQVVCFLFMFMYLLVPKTSFTRLPLCSANGGKIIICGPPLSVIPLCCVVFFFFSLFTNVGLVVTYPFFSYCTLFLLSSFCLVCHFSLCAPDQTSTLGLVTAGEDAMYNRTCAPAGEGEAPPSSGSASKEENEGKMLG